MTAAPSTILRGSHVHHPWHSCGLSTLQHRAQFAAERATYSINCTFVVSMYCRILLVSVGGLMSYMVPGVVCELTRDGLSSDRRDVRDGSQLCAFMKILAVLFTRAHAEPSTRRQRRRLIEPSSTAHAVTSEPAAAAPPTPQSPPQRTAAGTWDVGPATHLAGTGHGAARAGGGAPARSPEGRDPDEVRAGADAEGSAWGRAFLHPGLCSVVVPRRAGRTCPHGARRWGVGHHICRILC